MERMNMSARAYDRILKVARTIADLEGTADVLDHHNRGAHQPTATSTAQATYALRYKIEIPVTPVYISPIDSMDNVVGFTSKELYLFFFFFCNSILRCFESY